MSKNSTDNTIHSLSQFKHCSQILAYSLAQHRENCEQIPLINALPLVMEEKSQSKDDHIFSAGNAIYKEALSLVESRIAPTTPSAILDELRTQPRINVSSLIIIKIPATGKEWRGSLANISWGGLRIRSKDQLGKAGDSLELSLPFPEQEDIHIQASIVRIWEEDELYCTAIRFSKLSQKSESKLNKLLELLLNEEDSQLRRDTRFAQRIDISYWDDEELKATLEDISRGGMMITMPDPVEMNKSIKIQLDGANDAYSLSLRARVIRTETITLSDFTMYQMALEFEHPTEELRSLVQGLMQGLMHNGHIPTLY
ncbi:MAG: PilZ domain-containing protein [gamma proteobacterium symbiont of Taylorina sp.]|nr:PilZ domain-containing protein [gamma proteobacterium symbiont of Taylorina sp.]